MPKGLYFIAVVFSFFLRFFRRLISEVTKRISTKLGHLFTYDCYLKNVVRTPQAFTTQGLGQKNAFGTNFEL